MAGITKEDGSENGIRRRDIQKAIAQTAELRALHAALLQGGNGNSPTLRFPATSPLSFHNPNVSAQDYPVFTPSYDNDIMAGYRQIPPESWNSGDSWGDEYRTPNASSRKNLSRSSLEETKSLSSCSKCKPAVITKDTDVLKSGRKSNIVVPLMDSHSSPRPQTKKKGIGFSWLMMKMKKNSNKNGDLHTEEQSQISKETGALPLSIELLKREVIEANQRRDLASSQVTEMKSSLGELTQKLEYLENYCEELKMALGQAVPVKICNPSEKQHYKRGKSIDGLTTDESTPIPVTGQVMEEGFLQIVSEARVSVKHLCKTLLKQIDEQDYGVIENLNTMLQPHNLDLISSKSSKKAVVYHLESILNQALYQDFENFIYQNSGAPRILNPQKRRQEQFESFVALRDLSWNEVLSKGTKYYSEEFSKFCDQKMSGIIGILQWTRPWPEQLLEAFFMSAKCLWLLHLLAYSFDRPLEILRVRENAAFDAHYMEDVFSGRQQMDGGGERVKIMVMPGFYVVNKVLKCKVLCVNR